MSDKVTYTAEDIRMYVEGKMSPTQMHALESAALTDPFLADALEGMEAYGGKEKFNADVHELHARLAEKVKGKRGRLVSMTYLWWKIAAVLIIVVTGVAIIVYTGNKNKTGQDEFAKTENKASEDNRKVKDQDIFLKPQTADSEITKRVKPTGATDKDIGTQSSRQKLPPVKRDEKPALFNKAETQNPEREQEATVQENVAASKKPSAASVPASDSVTQQLQGKVAGLEIAQSKDPDSMFDEVIVVGNNNGKNDNTKSKTVIAGRAERRVVPGNGWDEFQRYIEDSTKINTADSVFTGEEHLAFTIGDDGLPESIKILRSISPSHDREAIRLLQNGPYWKVTKGRKREIRLKLIF